MSKLYLKHSILTRSNTITTHNKFLWMFFTSVFFPFTAFLTKFLMGYLDTKRFDDIRCWQIQTVWILCSQMHVFGLINSSPNAQRNLKRAWEEPSLSANVGRIWYKTYVLYANISKMFKKKTPDQNMSCYIYCSINTSFGFILKFNYFRFTAFCNISSMVEWVLIP